MGEENSSISSEAEEKYRLLTEELQQHRDNLERLVAERTEQLRRSECHYRTLVENTPLVFSRYDKEFRYLYMSPQWDDYFGLNGHMLLGKTWAESGIPAEVYLPWAEKLAEVLNTGRVVEFETTYMNKYGETRNYLARIVPETDEAGRVESLLSVALDITERKRMEEKLRESELRFRMLFNNVNDAIFLLELDRQGRAGTFTEVNDVACQRLGYSREELLGFTVNDIYEDTSHGAEVKFLARLKAEGMATKEDVHRAKDGTLIPVELSARSFSHEGKAYILTTARDLTERHDTERLLRSSYIRIKRNDLLNKITETKNLPEQQAKLLLQEAGLPSARPLTCYLVQMREWKGKPREFWEQHLEELHYLQDNKLDLFNEDPCILAWKCPDGVGILYAGSGSGQDGKSSQLEIAEKLLEKLAFRIPNLTVCIGVSEPSGESLNVREHYQQCCSAINAGRNIWPERKIYHYLDLGILQLFPQIKNQEQLALYVDRILGKLLLHESPKNVDYLMTLEAILESSNLNDTANKLFIHLKTLDFRKRRIEQIMGISLDCFETRMALGLALKLRKIGLDNQGLSFSRL